MQITSSGDLHDDKSATAEFVRRGRRGDQRPSPITRKCMSFDHLDVVDTLLVLLVAVQQDHNLSAASRTLVVHGAKLLNQMRNDLEAEAEAIDTQE